MRKYTIVIQSGLDVIKNLLRKEGHNVFNIGECKVEEDILIISGVDGEYVGIQPAECRIFREEKKLFVINASEFIPQEIVELVKYNTCN